MTSVADVLARAPHVLLDFDGPICAVFGGTSDRAVADLLRHTLAEQVDHLPSSVMDTGDPFDVLRDAATLKPDSVVVIERRLAELEVQAVATAPSTANAREAIISLEETGHSITVVSNNSAEAVAAYLREHELTSHITGIVGRTNSSPDLLKPNPYLLHKAMSARGARPIECVLIGD
jgi:beta-phosphoglucomutase-like phosphatase (HAD superfamily)